MREQKGLTQEQLAKRSGISCRMIQKYESGVSRPRFEAAEKYGSKGAKQAEQLMAEVTGLFAGGEYGCDDESHHGSILDCQREEQEVYT